MKELTVSIALRVIKLPIISEQLMTAFNLSPFLADQIETQWTNLTNIKWTELTDSLKFWFEVYEFTDSTMSHPFRELAAFVFTVLALHLSNADVERVFSQMNIVKNVAKSNESNVY